jgi:CHAT domain-containing protein
MSQQLPRRLYLAAIVLGFLPLFAPASQLTEDDAFQMLEKAAKLRDACEYAGAEKLYKQVLAEVPRLWGAESEHHALVLALLGGVYFQTGRYEQAEPLYKRSLEITESRSGKDHLDVAPLVGCLAGLATETGRYEQAELLYKRCLAISEAHQDHLGTAICLADLGAMYRSMGRYEQAEAQFKRSVEIFETKLAQEDHLPDLAGSLSGLADVFLRTRNYDQAERLHKRALEIREAKLSKDHPYVAYSLNSLASVYSAMGRYDQAERLYKRGLAILEARFGKDHISAATIAGNLAIVYARMNRLDLASANLDRGRHSFQKHIARILPTLRASDQLDFLRNTDNHSLAVALSLALRDAANLADLSAGWLLNAKGMALRSRSQMLLAIRDSRDPQLAGNLRDLLAVRQQLAQRAILGARPGHEDEDRTRLRELAEREQTLVDRLQRQGATVQPLEWVDLKDVQSALPPSGAFVDFALFPTFDILKGTDQPAHYAAWITLPRGPTRLIDLGEARAIDEAVAEVRKALENAGQTLKTEGEIKAEKAVREPLAKLAKLVLEPLRMNLDKAERWILSPDGALWLVPWGGLPLDEKTYAVEKHSIQLVVGGRDLLPARPIPGQTSTPAIFADPDFDGAPEALPSETRGLSGELKLGRIPRLPGTATEADAVKEKIARVFGAAPAVFTESKATCAAFLRLKRPRSLALATHGFFLPDQEIDPKEKERLQRDPGAKPLSRIEDPLLRCGLLLAGCNKPGDAGRAGVLTGREVLSADLRGCELVILSACQTGLGDIHQGEGVAGLRQAFQLAGAESVLASLWQVPDDETTLQMVAFMDALAKGKDRVEALAQAQRQRILQRREKFGAAHPFNWAAFTLTGAAAGQR